MWVSHCVKYRNFTKFLGVEILSKDTVFLEFLGQCQCLFSWCFLVKLFMISFFRDKRVLGSLYGWWVPVSKRVYLMVFFIGDKLLVNW